MYLVGTLVLVSLAVSFSELVLIKGILCRQMWFDLDHVDLSPGRRDYLQYKFGTVKVLNNRNNLFLPWFVQMLVLKSCFPWYRTNSICL